MAIDAGDTKNLILSRSSPPFGTPAEMVTFRAGEEILLANQTTAHVFFPVTVVASFVRRLLDGSTIEVGMVGCEGAIGIEVMLGATAQPNDAIALVAGTAMRVPAATAGKVFDTDPEFRRLVLRFANAFTLQVQQTAVCNWFHPLDRRLARWLLKITNRATPDNPRPLEISMTQEFLAGMLGTRIASVNEAVSTLTAAGLIRHRRHLIEVIDEAGLEAQACECHATVRALYERDQVI